MIKRELWDELQVSVRLDFVLVVLLLHALSPGISERDERVHAPCYDCDMLDIAQKDHLMQKRQVSGDCDHTCQCSNREIQCKAGVNVIKDGCNCCHMCARQQGDQCSFKDRCDEDKELYCDYQEEDGETGICRATHGKPCRVKGVTYRDGEEFKPSCDRVCSCQNGNYACTSLCPQEERRPSSVHCNILQLVAITGLCCKEWVCSNSQSLQETDNEISATNDKNSTFHNCSEHLRNHQHMTLSVNTDSTDDSDWLTEAANDGHHEPCHYETSAWSSCSVSCGMGHSTRLTNRNDECQPVEKGKKCKNTWRQGEPIRFEYDGCSSVKQYRPKYCSTCKRKRCCYPDKTKTNAMEWTCEDGKNAVHDFMWIKGCVCKDKCP